MRRTLTATASAVLLLLPAALLRGDDAPKGDGDPEADWKALAACVWVNDKPDASWAALSDDQKNAYGGNGWRKAEVTFSATAGKGAPKRRVAIAFTAVGKDEAIPSWEVPGPTLGEDKVGRFFALREGDAEYKIRYSLKDGKLTLKGTYYSGNPQVVTPTMFDGEYIPAPAKKE